MSKRILLFTLLLFLTACQEKAKPVIIKSSTVETPLSCLNLPIINKEDKLLQHLNTLYAFKSNCSYTLTLSYKKDITCNSTQNIGLKTMGKFPRSFIKLEVRKGLTVVYSYYVDLYSNIDNNDIEEGFAYLKNDLIKDTQ